MPAPRRAPPRLLLSLAVALLLLAGLGLWSLVGGHDVGARGGDVLGADGERARVPRTAAPAAIDAAVGEAPAGCAPARAEVRCVAGDLFWVDGCGRPGEKHVECGTGLCREGACEPVDEQACRDLATEGRCEGDVAVGCIGGHPYRADCGARDRRCVDGEEGAVCVPRTDAPCDPEEPPSCEGERLLRCVDGARVETDCARAGARCVVVEGLGSAGCERSQTLPQAPDPDAACGPCGCPEPARAGLDGCNGLDDDGDGSFDEDGACEPLDVVAFVVTDDGGAGSYAIEDLDREIERVRRVLSEGPLGVEVTLADVVYLPRGEWLELDDEEFAALYQTDALSLPREALYVPVVFTDQVLSGDVPKAGVSTLPNGRCGGQRVGDTPHTPMGAIAVSKARAPTTVAHEIGHYLGLCHTHRGHGDAVHRVVEWRTADGELVRRRCAPACVLDGDGICDTPPDPGPERCPYDPLCGVHCDGDAQPDPFNVMSYYTACRHGLSELQRLELRRNVALRRGWHLCPTPATCPCDPLAPSCPGEMSCRPSGDPRLPWGCSLDGPAPVGADCEDHAECGAEALCTRIAGQERLRCHRPCRPTDTCACHLAPGLPFQVCETTGESS